MRRTWVAVAKWAGLLLWAVAAVPVRAQAPAPAAAELPLEVRINTHYRAGEFAAALPLAELALTRARLEHGPEHEKVSIAAFTLGLIAERVGRLDLAEQAMRTRLTIAEKVYGANNASSGQAMQSLGQVLLKRGRIEEAEALFQKVLKVWVDLLGSEHTASASVRADLGNVALARKDYSTALNYFRDAVRILTNYKPPQVLARSIADEDIHRHRAAFAGLAAAIWENGRAGPPAGSAGRDGATALAESLAASQQAWATTAAAALARMAARLGAGDTDLGRRVRVLQDKSERVLKLHAEDAELLKERSVLQRADPAYSAALDAFRQASIANARETQPFVERQRVLVDQLQKHLARCPPGKKVAGCEAADKEREVITKELSGLSGSAGKNNQELAAVSQRLQAADERVGDYKAFKAHRDYLIDESQKLEREIAVEKATVVKAFPEYVALTEPAPLKVADIQALLRTDEAIVTILTGADRSFVWAISKTRAEWAPIEAGEVALSDHVAALRKGLDTDAPVTSGTAPPVTPDFDLARAHALYRLVLEPVAAVLEGRRHVILVPTGPLTSLPFHVLLMAATPPAANDAATLRTAPWLIRRHALSVLPSVQSLAAVRRIAALQPGALPFLGIGDPLLASPPGGAGSARGQKHPVRNAAAVYRDGKPDLRAIRGLAPLPETAYELQTIAKALAAPPGSLWLRADATETRLKGTRIDGYRVIQFATHGIVGGEMRGLEEPALVLTPPMQPTDIDDGLLAASEIAALKLNADWVVLSACNTASGTTAGAEALSGLARAFFFAGARALLVSHWAVDSEAAIGLTTQTFARLAAQPAMGRAEAFRRTMLEMIEAGRPPSYWAPFVIVGEGGGN